MPRKGGFLVVAGALVLMLAACRQPGNNIELDGTQWTLVEMAGQAPIAGSTITIRFEDGQVSGHLSCNSFSGAYSLRGEQIEFGMLMSTLMACVDDNLMQQESRLMELLGQVESVQIVEGDLHLILQDGQQLVYAPME